MAGQLLAKIAVEKAAYHFDKLYDYLVPDGPGNGDGALP